MHHMVKLSLFKYLATKNKLNWSHTFKKETNFNICKNSLFIKFR